jgi:hypothetical protein
MPHTSGAIGESSLPNHPAKNLEIPPDANWMNGVFPVLLSPVWLIT